MVGWKLGMDTVKRTKIFWVITLVLFLFGCGGEERFSDLETNMEAIKRKPSGAIEPPPKFRSFENYIYSASLLRSPFQPPIVIEKPKAVVQGRKVTPDLNRVKEPLEEFSIESLAMVGTINRKGKELFALIQDSKGGIQRVAVGNYMGKNHGKITKISMQQIDLLELIPDGLSGWVERPRSVSMQIKK